MGDKIMKRKFLILLCLILFIVSIAGVSATEDVNQIVDDGANDLVSNVDILSVSAVEDVNQTIDDDALSVSEDVDVISAKDDGTFTALQKKIDEAVEGSEINLENDYRSGEYEGMSITKSLTINGNGHTIDAQNNGYIFDIESDNVVLKNINFINAHLIYQIPTKGYGAAVNIHANNTIIQDCNFRNNSIQLSIGKAYGGAISGNGNLTIINSIFESNNIFADTDSFGGAVCCSGDLNLLNSRFISNSAGGTGGYGAAVYCRGHLVVNDCSFEDNILTSWDSGEGGAIYCDGDADIVNSSFISNRGPYLIGGRGGAISLNGAVNISDSNFTRNSLSGYDVDGGAIYAMTVNAKNSVFTDNYVEAKSNPYFTPSAMGGAIFTEKADINGCDLINNSASTGDEQSSIGGAIIAYDITNIEGSNFMNNSADDGEALWAYEAFTIIENCTFINNNYTLVDASFEIDAPELVKYCGGPERFTVTLTNNGTAIPAALVMISLNGIDYYRFTDEQGIASMAINLGSGKYDVAVKYGTYIVNSTVTVKPTVFGENITKIFRNATQYYAKFLDTEGDLLTNSMVCFNINGVFYTRTTNASGVAKMNINLNPGEYIITATNPNSNEMHSNVVTVLPNIVENHDLTKYYKNASQYVIRLLDDRGKPVGAGVSVEFNINGVFYKRTSNATGHVKMNINLNPGTYIITANYKGLMVSNTINVLSILQAKNLYMKYKDGSKFEAKLLDGQGNPFAGQKIIFNINGVFYDRTTDENGIARLNINLLPGEYIITSSYNGLNAANKITISG